MEFLDFSANVMQQLEVLGRVALAMLLGGLIGFERELRSRPAGFRTHMIVSGSAALLMGLGDAMVAHFVPGQGESGTRSDPIRIMEAIITGISFLGAGTIFFRGDRGGGTTTEGRPQTEHVEGLTTAASILLSAGIGVSVALRQYVLAVSVTVLALIVLRTLERVENWVHRRQDERRKQAEAS